MTIGRALRSMRKEIIHDRRAFAIVVVFFSLGCLFLGIVPRARAATYYVDSAGGSDSNNGTSSSTPWQTIAKVNSLTFNPGDNILFKDGDTWREQLNVPSSGASGTPITFGAYGSGTLPVISGSNIFTSWADNSIGSYTFWDGFESGNTSAWTSVTDSASKLSIESSTVLDGNYSMQITNNNDTPSYVTKSIAQLTSSTWYTQFKVELSSNFSIQHNSGTHVQLAEIANSNWGMIFEVYATNSGNNLYWSVDENRPSYFATTTASQIATGTLYTVQISSTGIGGTSGTYTMTVNGVTVYSTTGLALNGTQAEYEPDTYNLGVYASNATSPAGSLYFDDAWIDPSSTPSGGVANTWSTAVSTQPQVVYFNGTRGTNVTSTAGIVADKDWYWTGSNLYTYGTVNPNTTYPSQIEAGQRNYAIQFGSSGNSHLLFQNLDLVNTNSTGLNISAYGAPVTDVTVDGVTASGAYGYGIYINTDGNGHNLDTVTVKNSTLSYNGLAGITVGTPDTTTVSNVVIQNNTVYSNTWRWDNLDKAGIQAYGPTYLTKLTIQDNLVYNNGDALPNFKSTISGKRTGHGIYADTVGSGTIIRYNDVHDNNSGGISIESTDGATAYDNLSYDNGILGLSIYAGNFASANNLIYNNTAYGNEYGLAVWASSGVASQLTGNLVKNNISVNNTTNLLVQYGGENDGINGSGNVYLNNNFGPAASNFITWGAGNNLSTYAAFDSAYGSSTHSVAGDPLFSSTSTYNFTLTSSSPAIDAGLNLGTSYEYGLDPASTWSSNIILDNQNNYGSGWDIGPYVYTQTSTPSVVVTSPSNGATVSGSSVTIASSSAVSPASIASIQFYLDSNPLGSAITSTSSPNTYSYTWDTTQASNGIHSLYALATDNYGNTASSSVSVTVSNVASTPPTNVSIGVASGYATSGGGGIIANTQLEASSTAPSISSSTSTSLSTSSLKTELDTLLAELASLQAQAGQSSSSTSFSYVFTRNLQLYDTGNDVKELQVFLNSKGFVVSASGAGSPGNESTYFGPKTFQALVLFQESVGIHPASGYFGPITRAYVNNLEEASGTTQS